MELDIILRCRPLASSDFHTALDEPFATSQLYCLRLLSRMRRISSSSRRQARDNSCKIPRAPTQGKVQGIDRHPHPPPLPQDSRYTHRPKQPPTRRLTVSSPPHSREHRFATRTRWLMSLQSGQTPSVRAGKGVGDGTYFRHSVEIFLSSSIDSSSIAYARSFSQSQISVSANLSRNSSLALSL